MNMLNKLTHSQDAYPEVYNRIKCPFEIVKYANICSDILSSFDWLAIF